MTDSQVSPVSPASSAPWNSEHGAFAQRSSCTSGAWAFLHTNMIFSQLFTFLLLISSIEGIRGSKRLINEELGWGGGHRGRTSISEDYSIYDGPAVCSRAPASSN